MTTASACPFASGFVQDSSKGRKNRDWWPGQLDLSPLKRNSSKTDPMDPGFEYAKAFKSLDLAALKKDLVTIMKESQPWWPADYGHYGPFFIRMAWQTVHCPQAHTRQPADAHTHKCAWVYIQCSRFCTC